MPYYSSSDISNFNYQEKLVNGSMGKVQTNTQRQGKQKVINYWSLKAQEV